MKVGECIPKRVPETFLHAVNKMDEEKDAFAALHARQPMPTGPHGWLQWKGTQACIDLLCACGESFHMDEDFLYFVECPHCARTYAVSGYVNLVELSAAERATLADDQIKKR